MIVVEVYMAQDDQTLWPWRERTYANVAVGFGGELLCWGDPRVVGPGSASHHPDIVYAAGTWRQYRRVENVQDTTKRQEEGGSPDGS